MADELLKKTILLVEDDEAHIELISCAFENFDGGRAEIVIAGTVREAACTIKSKAVDIAISDYKLPDGSGQEIISAAAGSFPVIIMTSYGSEHLAVEMLKAGALDYIVKSPQTFSEMPHMVNRALREWGYINDRKKAREALIKNADNYLSLIETSGDLLARFDNEYKIIYISPSFEKYLKINAAAAAGLSIRNAGLDPRLLVFLEDNIKSVFESQKKAETDLVLPVGTEIKAFECRFFPEFDISSNIISVVCVMRDITARKKYEAELKKARDEAEAANTAKTLFLANMSHELRTPMNGIMGFTELLKMSDLGEEQKEFVELISLSSRHLLEIINDILDFSKIETGKLKLTKKKFSIRDNITKLFSFFDTINKNKELKLKYLIDSKIENSYIGDSLRINQILSNLLSNAIKFTPGGEVALAISEENRSESISIVKIAVSDSGIGISPERIDEIFDPFHQLENSYTKKYAGIGLGLSIVKNLVSLLDGEIKVESRLNRGTSFILTLPLERDLGEKSSEEFFKPQAARPAVEKSSAANAVKRILIAEDDFFNRKLMLKLLHEKGCEADIACDGREALEKYEKNTYGLILMDVQMPRLDGLSAIKTIREKEAAGAPRACIIAVTAFALKHQQEDFIAAGADGCIIKPFDIKDFWDEIKKYLH